MEEVIPGAAKGAVIFTDGAPGAFAEVGNPAFPVDLFLAMGLEAAVFRGHR
jgi:hypothetical protein